MRGIRTYLALGLDSLIDNMQKLSDMPVAIGAKKQLLMVKMPLSFKKSMRSSLVRRFRIDEPTAFGWTSVISPDLPIPWEKPIKLIEIVEIYFDLNPLFL